LYNGFRHLLLPEWNRCELRLYWRLISDQSDA
jgi:hypothetical protein